MCSSHPESSQGRWQGQGSVGFHHSYLGIPRVFTWGPFSLPPGTSPYLQVWLQILSSPLLTPQPLYQGGVFYHLPSARNPGETWILFFEVWPCFRWAGHPLCPGKSDYQVHWNDNLFCHLDLILAGCEHVLDFSGKKCVKRSCKCGQDMLGDWNRGNF